MILVKLTGIYLCVQIFNFCSACDVGWFGQDCKLQCHCTNNKCTDDGTCINGSRCDDEWFGPACQYQNLANVYTTTEKLGKPRVIDTMCNAAGYEDRMEVSWNISYPFTFLWVQFYQAYEISHNSVNVEISDVHSYCHSLYQSTISQNTIEFRCRTTVNMTRLVLTGGNVRNICSIYVSGGRNVAVKQYATQDSTYDVFLGRSDASNAVDGNRDSLWYRDSCIHTEIQTSKGTPHYWTVNFSGEAYSVNRYVLYSRWDFKPDPQSCCPERISGFTLTSWNNKGDHVFTCTAPKTLALVHTVVSGSRDVASVKVTLDVDYFNFCEAEIYGVNICPKNKYGLDCTKECNCVNNEQCHVDTGTCPSGCAPGYTFEGCQTECSEGRWGVDCRNFCSENCLHKDACDRVDGSCDWGSNELVSIKWIYVTSAVTAMTIVCAVIGLLIIARCKNKGSRTQSPIKIKGDKQEEPSQNLPSETVDDVVSNVSTSSRETREDFYEAIDDAQHTYVNLRSVL